MEDGDGDEEKMKKTQQEAAKLEVVQSTGPRRGNMDDKQRCSEPISTPKEPMRCVAPSHWRSRLRAEARPARAILPCYTGARDPGWPPSFWLLAFCPDYNTWLGPAGNSRLERRVRLQRVATEFVSACAWHAASKKGKKKSKSKKSKSKKK